MSTRAAIFAVSLAGLALGACGSTPPHPMYATSADLHKPVVTEEVARLDLRPGRGGVSPGDAPSVAAFLREYRDVGHGPLIVAAPSGDAAAAMADDVRAIGAEMSIALPDMAVGVSAGGQSSPYNLTFVRYRAHVAECGYEWPSLAQTARSETFANFGCATNSNMAAMIADPADLVWPREMTPADAQRRGTVLELYRAGEATASARGDQDSANVSGN
mgnify:CR=1 FL=1